MMDALIDRSGCSSRCADDLFAGSGELRALCREHAWDATLLGPVASWPPALCAAVRLVLDAQVAMALHVGPDLLTLYNDSYCSVLGAKHPGALGRPAAAVWSEIWPEIGPQIEAVFRSGAGFAKRDVPFALARLADGIVESCWFDYALSPVRDDGLDGAPGAIFALLAVVSETTARVLTEQELVVERARLGEIVRISPAFMAVLRGPTHIIERTNAGFDVLIGGRDVCGRAVVDALPEGTAQGFIALLDAVLATGDPFIGREIPYRRPDVHGVQDERFADFVYQAINEADGTRSGVFLHGVDVTEQVRARRDMERLLQESEVARAQAERANKAKSEFLAVMSHELRTPLNAIDGYAELMEMGLRGPLTIEQRHDLSRIRKSEKHLLHLIDGVLNYAQIEARAVQYLLEDVSVDIVLGTCEALCAPQLAVRGLHLRRARTDPTMRMRADLDKAQQIVLNVLSNAVKFTARGGAVRMCGEIDGEWVRIHIADTGIGIAHDQRDRIFEPFVQLDAGLTRTGEGTGLGLAISRDLARGMGGDLTVESTLGEGSTFTLRLPCAEGSAVWRDE